MARPTNHLFKIDRRRLLAQAAAAPVAVIVPSFESTQTDAVRPISLTPDVSALKICGATARRLLEIAQRNEIRRLAGLPVLSITKELRRMKKQADAEEFERFEAAHCNALWGQILRRRREAEGNPNWRPSWMEVMSYQSQVRKILREQFRVAR